jgi:hypothetical protein
MSWIIESVGTDPESGFAQWTVRQEGLHTSFKVNQDSALERDLKSGMKVEVTFDRLTGEAILVSPTAIRGVRIKQ